MEDWGERDLRWHGIRTEWMDVHGTAVCTLRADGPEEGTPTVLVHGLGGSATNWLEVMAGLARRGPVLAMDLPGFGETEPVRDTAVRVRSQARFVPALCRAVGWDRVTLMGNSMGGLITTLVAGHHTDLVDRLVLVNPGLPAPVRAAFKVPLTAVVTFAPFAVGAGERLMRYRFARKSPQELYDDTLRLILADPDGVRPAIRQIGVEAAEHARELPWRLPAFVAAAESIMSLLIGPGRARVNRALDAIEAPTLLLWGVEDKLVGRPVIDGLLERRPDWDLHVWEGVGHVPMVEVPDAFLRVVTGWLDRRRTPRDISA